MPEGYNRKIAADLRACRDSWKGRIMVDPVLLARAAAALDQADLGWQKFDMVMNAITEAAVQRP